MLVAFAFGVIYWILKKAYQAGGYHPVAQLPEDKK